MTRFLSAALAVLLTTNNLTSTTAQKNVCGSDYMDAADNCLDNTSCQLGDGCPSDQTCYSIPLNTPSCIPGPPTPSPTPMLKVCGTTSEDAQAKCPDASIHCPTGDGCATGTACFIVPFELCGVTNMPTAEPTKAVTASPVAPGPTPNPTEGPWQVCGSDYTDAANNCWTNTKCPTGDGCAAGTQCYALPAGSCPEPVAGAIVTPAPTPAPTPVPLPTNPPTPSSLGVCGLDYTDATSKFCRNAQCPTGDGCPAGMTCYSLPYQDCSDPVPEDATQAVQATVVATPDPTPAPTPNPTEAVAVAEAKPATLLTNPVTASPIYNTYFCGTDYNDANENCWTNGGCPTGDGCPSGMNCYPITSERCMSDAPTETPTSSPTTPTRAPSPIPTESPLVNTFFCGTDYMDAFASCSEGTACPSGGGCPGATSCFVGITCPAAHEAQQDVTLAAQTFDPNNTLYCGVTYDDATKNCYTNYACPNGAQEECPDGQSCYTTMGCSAPTPAVTPVDEPTPAVESPQTVEMAAFSGPEAVMGQTAAEEPMMKTSREPVEEEKPEWDMGQYTYDRSYNGAQAMYGGLFVQSMLVGVGIIVALVL